MNKAARAALAGVLALAVTGCYGPFNLTRKLHKWNGEIGEKWVNEAAFVGMVVFPVYFFATLGDAIVFNSVEFWTGKNPVTAKSTRTIQDGDRTAVLTYSPEDRRLRVDQFEKGRPAGTVIVEPSAQGMAARSADGVLLATARTRDGRLVAEDASGKLLAQD